MTLFMHFPDDPGSIEDFQPFLDPIWDLKIYQQFILGPKRGAGRRCFIDFGRGCCCSFLCGSICHRFVMKKTVDKIGVSFRGCARFFGLADPWGRARAQCFKHSIFHVSAFRGKIVKRRSETGIPKQHRKTRLRGSQTLLKMA